MVKLVIMVLLSFLLTNVASAQYRQSHSFYTAVVTASTSLPQSSGGSIISYTHEAEKNNSLARGILAKQGLAVKLQINTNSKVSYQRYSTASEKRNSLARGALVK